MGFLTSANHSNIGLLTLFVRHIFALSITKTVCLMHQ